MSRRVHQVVIIGAGFAGIGAAIKLQQGGVGDVVILERADRVGGTWRDATYPGAACDIPSVLYSYSFAQNPNWSRVFSPSAEILGYIESMVATYNLESSIRFGCEVTDLEFDEREGHWKVTSSQGTLLARAVVAASGPLSNASLPAIRGLDGYRGAKIHSARWDHTFDLRGKRVAVIGTGASAVQIIPEVVKQAEHVTVYQRTPGWVIPRPDASVPRAAQTLFAKAPLTQHLTRAATYWLHESMATGMVWPTPVTSAIETLGRAHLRAAVKDPWLRRQLTHDFRAGCKRMLVSSDYYPALQKPNCKLITWPIARFSEHGIRTGDGIERRFDAVIFATGYDVSKAGTPFPVKGLGGRILGEEWASGAHAYRSIQVSGFPNLYFTFGPNSGPGHNSALVYMEGQLDYLTREIKRIVERDLLFIDVRADAQERHNQSLQRRLNRTTWNSGCSSWYLTDDGFNATMYPGFATQYRYQMGRRPREDYREVASGASPAKTRPRERAARR